MFQAEFWPGNYSEPHRWSYLRWNGGVCSDSKEKKTEETRFKTKQNPNGQNKIPCYFFLLNLNKINKKKPKPNNQQTNLNPKTGEPCKTEVTQGSLQCPS